MILPTEFPALLHREYSNPKLLFRFITTIISPNNNSTITTKTVVITEDTKAANWHKR